MVWVTSAKHHVILLIQHGMPYCEYFNDSHRRIMSRIHLKGCRQTAPSIARDRDHAFSLVAMTIWDAKGKVWRMWTYCIECLFTSISYLCVTDTERFPCVHEVLNPINVPVIWYHRYTRPRHLSTILLVSGMGYFRSTEFLREWQKQKFFALHINVLEAVVHLISHFNTIRIEFQLFS